jgi:hypothetical protein
LFRRQLSNDFAERMPTNMEMILYPNFPEENNQDNLEQNELGPVVGSLGHYIVSKLYELLRESPNDFYMLVAACRSGDDRLEYPLNASALNLAAMDGTIYPGTAQAVEAYVRGEGLELYIVALEDEDDILPGYN